MTKLIKNYDLTIVAENVENSLIYNKLKRT